MHVHVRNRRGVCPNHPVVHDTNDWFTSRAACLLQSVTYSTRVAFLSLVLRPLLSFDSREALWKTVVVDGESPSAERRTKGYLVVSKNTLGC